MKPKVVGAVTAAAAIAATVAGVAIVRARRKATRRG